ncbi:MAG: hypothetical protein P4L50_27055 [Anaerolineaceae bacterium]|nr:hypothetical protein [Anaerolineaceae bacterium]
MNAPADTLNYMIAGYVVIFGIMIVYLASLLIRSHNLDQDEELLNELEKNQTNKEK